MSQRTKAVQERQHKYYVAHKDYLRDRFLALKLKDPEKLKQRQKSYYERRKLMFSDRHLKTNYGITKEQYELLLKEQNNACAICLKPSSSFQRALSVDHDHKTGQIRGLLCITCNLGLGCFNDDRKLFTNALIYLRRAFYAITI
jgi:hypothetical protein